MKLAIFGTGFVGLTTGACFASVGHDVTCYDIDEKKLASLRGCDSGIGSRVPFYEPGLEELVEAGLRAKCLRFVHAKDADLTDTEIVFVCVGTPSGKDGRCDTTALEATFDTIASKLLTGRGSKWPVLVIRSTCPPNARTAIEKRIGIKEICVNPEFLAEGSAVNDFMNPSRVIVGAERPEDARTIYLAYDPILSRTRAKFLQMSPASASIAKYAANGMLATRISFMNDIAAICDVVGADIKDIEISVGLDSRIGSQFLRAGIGFFGSCFDKDLRSLCAMSADRESDRVAFYDHAHVASAALQRNTDQIIDTEEWLCGQDAKRIAFWGIAFKPDTDDTRNGPLEIITDVAARVPQVIAYDPKAVVQGANFEQAKTALDAVRGADVLAILTEWREFKNVNWQLIAATMNPNAIVFDGRNICEPAEVRAAGLRYRGIGRR